MSWKSLCPALGLLLLILGCLGCQMERRKSDAELGLNPQQARGRYLYDQNCIRCHEPYSRWGVHETQPQEPLQKTLSAKRNACE